jgi:release factor glutamine methyltransferase
MFVADNRLSTAKNYFYNELNASFTPSECKSMWYSVLLKFFGWSGSEILLKSEERLSESDLLRIRSVVKRLQGNEPFQHIMGSVYFADIELMIDSRALIPRPETEELVACIANLPIEFESILDLCTGSGCIALALKNIYHRARTIGIDDSIDAIHLARQNAASTGLDVDFQQANIFEWQPTELFDLLVSNPPYIPDNEAIGMASHVLNFEPHMALFVPDDDPMLFYRRIVQLALSNLKSEGYLALEIHENKAKETLELLDSKQFKKRDIIVDLQGKHRMILAQKS